MTPHLIYLHGFLSSPQSFKAQQTLAYVKAHLPELPMHVPELPNYPGQAAKLLDDLVSSLGNVPLRFIGSSMGGFLSTFLVERFGGKAVLINPAVRPFELLVDYLGPHVNPYTDKQFTLTEQHIDELRALDTPSLRKPDSYWALLQTEDETLDYRQAEQKYAGGKLTIEQGGDHSFVGYDRFLPQIFEFLLDSE